MGGEYSPEPLINIKYSVYEMMYKMMGRCCLCVYILVFYYGVTEGFTKLGEDLCNDQLISQLQLRFESDKKDAS